jgi:hypothetical protein
VRWLSYGWYAVLLVLAVGAMALFAPGPGWLRIALAFVAFNLAIFLVLHVKSRYRIQLLPAFFLCAGLAADHWWRWWQGEPAARLSPARWLLATGCVGTVLYLACL